jgi:hypothetical protein
MLKGNLTTPTATHLIPPVAEIKWVPISTQRYNENYNYKYIRPKEMKTIYEKTDKLTEGKGAGAKGAEADAAPDMRLQQII